MTDRVAAERELIEAKAAAEAASRAKSEFLANMSHEIRTPLNGVIGIIDALSRTPLSAEQAEMVSLVRDSGVTLERLVSDFLDVSKIEAGQLHLEARPFDLDQALRPCIEVMRYRAEDKGLAFEVVSDADARGRFLGDATRIGQIVGNLISNAVKFTEKGGVTLRVGLVETQDETRLILTVEDTGIGFDADHAAHLFNRFSQADETISRRFGGTGLGLSICRSLARMMGGEVSAGSELGVGSRFVVSLPMPRAETLAAYDARAPLTAPAPCRVDDRPLRVLLAEDHPTNQRVVQLILGQPGRPSRHRRRRRPGGRGVSGRRLRRGADGHADARHGRPDRDPRHPRPGSRARRDSDPHRDAQRQRHDRTPGRGDRRRARTCMSPSPSPPPVSWRACRRPWRCPTQRSGSAREGRRRHPERSGICQRLRSLEARHVIYLCRHGQTAFNREHRLQGQMESDLTPLGRAQAGAMADLLRDLVQRDANRPWRIVASPLRRARDTAGIIGRSWACRSRSTTG